MDKDLYIALCDKTLVEVKALAAREEELNSLNSKSRGGGSSEGGMRPFGRRRGEYDTTL